MIGEGLRALLARLSDEDESVQVVETRATEGGLVIVLRTLPEEGEDVQRWEVRCRGVAEWTLSAGSGEFEPAILEDHPLLWAHLHPHLELHVNGVAPAPDRLLNLLLREYEAATGLNPWNGDQWLLPTGLRPIPVLDDILRDGFGLLAKGPKPLVDAYAAVLAREGIPHTVLDRGRLPAWTRHDREAVSPRLLLIGGASVVATSFDARLVPTPPSEAGQGN